MTVSHSLLSLNWSRQRLIAAQEVSKHLENSDSFSFLRLGDAELLFLTQIQSRTWSDSRYDATHFKPSVENALGISGLRAKDYERLLQAYERCDYLDYYKHQDSNRRLIPQLKWSRRNDGINNCSYEQSGIVNDWTLFEFPKWIAKHRCLIYGSESFLLYSLLESPQFRTISAHIISNPDNLVLRSPPDRGLFASRDLETIKDDIKCILREQSCDTLFLCLGGLAKILAFELANESKVRAIDWGSMLRALTYSGSDGYATWRSSHNPFYFRVPFSVYMKALVQSAPNETASYYLSKAHAQLALELQHHQVGRSLPAEIHSPDSLDLSWNSKRRFRISYLDYKRNWLRRSAASAEAKALVDEFSRWRRFHGIGVDGWLFRTLFNIKEYFKPTLKKIIPSFFLKFLMRLSAFLFGR